MSRLIKSEIKCISLYLEEEYINYLISRRIRRILEEMKEFEREIEEEILQELENF